jgi:hypothetical protein
VVDPAQTPLLPAHTWETSYRHEDGDLIRLFYVPALSCAAQYDQTRSGTRTRSGTGPKRDRSDIAKRSEAGQVRYC